MARRVFLFLVVPVNLAANAKQKSSAPPPTHDEFTRAQRASRFELSKRAGYSTSGQKRANAPCLLTRVGSYSWDFTRGIWPLS